MPGARPPNPHPLVAKRNQLIAHRGGAGLYPENTLEAFTHAVRDWSADMLELDVRATADGQCVVHHDPTIDRTTNGHGRIADMTFAALQAFDAGYTYTPDGGRTFPFRGRGVRIPLFADVLEALPDTPIIVEIKTGDVQQPLQELIGRYDATDRIILAGERERDRTLFADYPGARSASVERMRSFFLLHQIRCDRWARPDFEVVQAPEKYAGRRIVTKRLIAALHAQGIPIHIWTVNDEADMKRLLEWGVDGILTDFPDRLSRVLQQHGGRAPAPIERSASLE